MSQARDYPYEVRLADEASLQRVVRGLMDEADRGLHHHNFEVWADELTIRVNELGLECVQRLAEPAEPRASVGAGTPLMHGVGDWYG